MTSQELAGALHPSSRAKRARCGASAFGLLGGPLAWFVQLCCGYALASWPCFAGQQGRLAPPSGDDWTWPAMILVLLGGVAIAVASLLVSWRTLRRMRQRGAPVHPHLIATGAGCTRFLALWGVLLGAGFALLTALTAVGLWVLPRCAG